MKIPKSSAWLGSYAGTYIHDDYFGEQFSDEVLARIDLVLCDTHITEGLSLKEKRKMCQDLEHFLGKASRFFAYLEKRGRYKGAGLVE